MTEALLESAVMARLAEVLPQGVEIVGAWQTFAAGLVKGQDTGEADARAEVVASPRSFDNFTTPSANFPIAVTLKVRAERDPQGELFAACADALLALLQSWQTSIAAVKSALAVDGFAPCGVKLDGGEVSFDEDAVAYVVSETFTVRGVVISQQTGEQ